MIKGNEDELRSVLGTDTKKSLSGKKIPDKLANKQKLDEIEIRAAKNSFQVLIDMLIGKSK
ncbi:hypothetical protein [Nitratiruptor tergarcus]|uniref:Uncharacterized protein n=1 Tax=Nitratiruptor tergarcus DSM 16512 TaxID=1069081 RepID=A0A1W1WTK3_9BACT|nr:hypothetical protein [Nitratiruptor tergarcus]SMC09519.1 hypothetical protein SAMN05660197_1333 [Nitratiruptor tergarcus DSM 16512]